MLDRSLSTVSLIGREAGPAHRKYTQSWWCFTSYMHTSHSVSGFYSKFTFVCESSLYQQQKKAHREERSCAECHPVWYLSSDVSLKSQRLSTYSTPNSQLWEHSGLWVPLLMLSPWCHFLNESETKTLISYLTNVTASHCYCCGLWKDKHSYLSINHHLVD